MPLQQLFYFVIFGNIEESLPPFESNRYRTSGVPDGIELEFVSRDESLNVWEQFQIGPAWDAFRSSNPVLEQAMLQCPSCVIVRGQIPDGDTLEPLASTIGVITSLLDAGGIAVCDVLTASWFDTLDWKLSVFEPGMEGLAKLVVVNLERLDRNLPETGELWVYTRGMRRFARPDVSFTKLPANMTDLGKKLVEYLAYSMIDGAVIPNGKELFFRNTENDSVAVEHLTAYDPDYSKGIRVRCELSGGLDDPHFFNFYLNLTIVS